MAKKRANSDEMKLSMQAYWDSLTDDEKAQQKADMNLLNLMRDQRETPLKEFDGLTYSQRYEINKEADLAYNDLIGDVDGRDKGFSMRTGVTRNKVTSILSHAASFEFEPQITAFDKENRLVVELGENTGDLVKRSREIESYQDKKYAIYRELIAQGDVFVEEQFVQKFMFDKDAKNNDGQDWQPGQKINAYKKDETPLIRVQEDCESNLILGKYIYLASLTESDIQKQSAVATYSEISLAEFSRVYGNWDRAEFVKYSAKSGKYTDSLSQIFNQGGQSSGRSFGTWGADYFWNLRNPGKNVGIVKVYKPFSNRYMIYANGIQLLPVDFPLTKISPSGLIPIAHGCAERIQGFAYSKGIPSNTYVDEKIYNYVYQAMVKKIMQSAEPTLANNTGREMPRDWARPGLMYRGLKAAMIEPLLPESTRTINNSDANFFATVKEILNEKSIDDSFSGGQQPTGQTATVYLQEQKNTIQKLFQVIDGIKSLERQEVKLRIANIYTNWTRHEDTSIQKEVVEIVEGIPTIIDVKNESQKKYRQESIYTKIPQENQAGVKIIRFHDVSDLPDIYAQIQEEDDLTDLFGMPARVVYMHAPSLSRLFDFTYRIDIIPRDTNGSEAQLMAYMGVKQQVAGVFGSQVINVDYTLQRVAEFQDEDPNKAYNIGQQAMQEQQASQGQTLPGAPDGTQVNSPISQAFNAMQPGLAPQM